MLVYISTHYQKRIALLLYFIFYLQFVGFSLSTKYLNPATFLNSSYRLTKNNPANQQVSVNDVDFTDAIENKIVATKETDKAINDVLKNISLSTNAPLIGGPGQPEMSTFKSVGADNMVNQFTGDFSYNIPLLDVGGYPINIFYNAGIGMDQEASWVGLGWNINPGTVSRNMRGLPDDYDGSAANGDKIVKKQHTKPDITVAVNFNKSFEASGFPGNIGSTKTFTWNNKRGLGIAFGRSANFAAQETIADGSGTETTQHDTSTVSTSATFGFNLSSQSGLSLSANASYDKQNKIKDNFLLNGVSTGLDYNSRQGINSLRIDGETKMYDKVYKSTTDGALPGIFGTTISFARSSYMPGIRMPITRFSTQLSFKKGKEFYLLNQSKQISGSLDVALIAPDDVEQEKPAFGYMYYQNANDRDDGLLDFNRINDGVYTLKTPVISIPNYTYDVFSISGEGTGGSFRGYRGDIGFVRDHRTVSREGALNLDFEFGTDKTFKVGATIGGVYTTNVVGDWENNNSLRNSIAFKKSDKDFQSFYFKNPGEKAIIDEQFYTTIGNDNLVRPKLTGYGFANVAPGVGVNLPRGLALPLLKNALEMFDGQKNYVKDLNLTESNSIKKIRDKRNQIISFLTAEEAERVGLDSKIISCEENVFNHYGCIPKSYIRRHNNNIEGTTYRKSHHLSQIDVLEGDGKRYVYGLPAYTIRQKDASFSIAPSQYKDINQQTTTYSDYQDSTLNTDGRDGFYQTEVINGYAHSFLLTGILSPDYVDVLGDGVTDDDIGTAIKFNYTRVNKYNNNNTWVNQNWRSPMVKNSPYSIAHLNQGLKSDNADDKALYTFGTKELWYTHSIETKNLIATFTLGDRDDGKQAINEDGGVSPNYGQKKLERIDLYTKADFYKYSKADFYKLKPIKTVHFSYSYNLCKNANNNLTNNGGKLTLDSIWFSYNGNYKKTSNKYRFKYATDKELSNGSTVNTNPDYNSVNSDRWGTYKDRFANPASMRNDEFPYPLQSPSDKEKSDAFASAWNLEKIQLPSGAVINVAYEADDYAYVQNKRAAQMTKIAGFAMNATDAPTNTLYEFDILKFAQPGKMDKRFVFFDVDDPITSTTPAEIKKEINEKYLDGVSQILMKLWVKMPNDPYSEFTDGLEAINIYSSYNKDNYGVVAGNNKRIFIELEPTAKEGSAMMETIIQFAKDMLPSKVYKGVDIGNQQGVLQVVSALGGLIEGFMQAIQGFENNFKGKAKCKSVELSKSYGRLNNPFFKKVGGGHRVKSIVISDNWQKMIDPLAPPTKKLNSFYGQFYYYKTTEKIGNNDKEISSGVATYEPGIGNEENPFREILKYSDKQPLGPSNTFNVELPVTETFFPSPSVGYSKVVVRSIHHDDGTKKIKSNTGLTETQYFTSKDFPVITDFTDFDGNSRAHYKPSAITRFLFKLNVDYLTLTQGFRVVLNDMHGKIKSQASYSESDFRSPINYTRYYYRMENNTGNTYKLNNQVKVIEGAKGESKMKLVGKDVEIMADFRNHLSVTRSAQIPLNLDATDLTPVPFMLIVPTIFNATFGARKMVRSATTLKVVNNYGMIDSVVNIDKGSHVSTENLVFDAETGETLISKTNNDFNKPVYNLSYPAHWVNSGMDLAYKNIDVVYQNVVFNKGMITSINGDGTSAAFKESVNRFESGDELYVVDQSNTNLIRNSDACYNNGDPRYLPLSDQFKIWAVDLTKDSRNPADPTMKQFIFLDRFGNPYNSSATGANIRIIRSGKRNMGSVAVGSITSLQNPLVTANNKEEIKISNSTKVLNASAAEFNEKWKVQEAYYSTDTIVYNKQYVPIKSLIARPTDDYSISKFKWKGNADFQEYYYDGTMNGTGNPLDFFMARNQSDGSNDRNMRRQQKSWWKFDAVSTIPPNSVILSAKLNLLSHDGDESSSIINHNFMFYNSNNNGVFTEGSHTAINPQSFSHLYHSNFKINRMMGIWPAKNDKHRWNDWAGNNAYDNYQEYSNQGQVNVLAPTFSPAAVDYPGDFGEIDMKGLVIGMVKDYHDPLKRYSPAIKISMLYESNHQNDAFVCFTKKKRKFEDNHTRPIKESELIINYYNCEDALPTGAPLPPNANGYDSCITKVTGKLCFSVFTKKQMNPYVYGVLGNWKPWRSYVYYGAREQKIPTNSTNISKDGVIDNFENYWLTGGDLLQRNTSDKWVWNSEVTQFNRKGGEIENHDPLGRYNSGVYGYMETLPTAVANNARVREIAFEGFEDHSYKDNACNPTFCSPYKRHFKVGDINSMISTTQHHTGIASLKIAPNTSYTFNSPILPNSDVHVPDVKIEIAKVPFSDTLLNASGNGLSVKYYNNNTFDGAPVYDNPSISSVPTILYNDNNCRSFLPLNVSCTNVSMVWEGYIQMPESGTFKFDLGSNIVDDFGEVYINNNLVYGAWNTGDVFTDQEVNLLKGEFYPIKVKYNNIHEAARMQLRYRPKTITSIFGMNPIAHFALAYPVQRQHLYRLNQPTNPRTVQTAYCIKPGTINSISNNLIDSFSLIPNKKYVFSAWVKEGTANCECNDYLQNNVKILVDDVIIPNSSTSYKPSGNIIEGWQRYDFDFTIPNNANKLAIQINNTSSNKDLFIDDIRIFPFNSNLKSFVYNPFNLRLTAELDENNYSSFYEYDDEGTLVRVKKETQAGVKTIKETRSSLQKSLYNF